jgi:hypothetical protein
MDNTSFKDRRMLYRGGYRVQRALHQLPAPLLLAGWRQARVAGGVRDPPARHDARRTHLLGNGHQVRDQGGGDAGALQLLGKR